MPIEGLRPGVIDQLRPFLKDTVGYLLAEGKDCLEIQRREIQTIRNRDFRSIRSDELRRLKPPASWLLGVLVCPDDSHDAVAEFAARLPPSDRSRFRFYVFANADLGTAMRRWTELGLGPVQADEISNWNGFHARFGADHAIRVYQDHVWRRH